VGKGWLVPGFTIDDNPLLVDCDRLISSVDDRFSEFLFIDGLFHNQEHPEKGLALGL